MEQVITEAGLLVSADAASALQPPRGSSRAVVAYDVDERRRVVISKADWKKINGVIRMLARHGLAMVVACQDRQDLRTPCKSLMIDEGQGGADQGIGCQCTRVHVL